MEVWFLVRVEKRFCVDGNRITIFVWLHSASDLQFVNADLDRLSRLHFSAFAGLDFAAIHFDGIAPHAFQFEGAFLFRQNGVFAADFLIAIEFHIHWKIFRAATDFDFGFG